MYLLPFLHCGVPMYTSYPITFFVFCFLFFFLFFVCCCVRVASSLHNSLLPLYSLSQYHFSKREREMGQRHQIYIAYGENNRIGIHHQWLYGRTAVMQVYINIIPFNFIYYLLLVFFSLLSFTPQIGLPNDDSCSCP
jgi:hypothetical protein